jgi:hypothetical protein
MTDTSSAAANLQLQVLRRLPAERRLALAVEMSLAARALLIAGLHAEHPQWSPDQLRQSVLRLLLPAEALPPQSR